MIDLPIVKETEVWVFLTKEFHSTLGSLLQDFHFHSMVNVLLKSYRWLCYSVKTLPLLGGLDLAILVIDSFPL